MEQKYYKERERYEELLRQLEEVGVDVSALIDEMSSPENIALDTIMRKRDDFELE